MQTHNMPFPSNYKGKMIDQISLGIIIPYYNIPHSFLKASLCSVYNAASKRPGISVTICIVNDASPIPLPDLKTMDLPESEAVQINLISHDTNTGLAEARNSGYKALKNSVDYLLFLDSDDLLNTLPNITGHEDAIFGSFRFFTDQENLNLAHSISIKPSIFISSLQYRNLMPCCSILVRADKLAGEQIFQKNLRACEDWCFWIEYFSNSKHYNLKFDASFSTSIRKSNTSLSASVERMFMNRITMFNYLINKGVVKKWVALTHILLSKAIISKINVRERFSLLTIGLFGVLLAVIKNKNISFQHYAFCIFLAFSPSQGRRIINRRYIRRAQGIVF
jgi:hypothetical protein